MKIYTRTGDDGSTGLFGGPRVEKDDPRIEAYGTVDELNAALGLARTATDDPELESQLQQIQNDLFAIGAELATPNPESHSLPRIGSTEIGRLESWIDRLEAELEPLRQFILPAGTDAAARLHMARGTCRRAERRVVTLGHDPAVQISQHVICYLNRLSDLLFVQSRFANQRAGVADVPWQKTTDPAS